MKILGVSCYYHDSAAALLVDGEVVAAAQEERFSRKRHDQDFPTHAVRYCLEEAGLSASDLDYVGFYDKPLLKFERILTTYVATWPRSYRSFLMATPLWLKEKLWTPHNLREHLTGYGGDILFTEHHMSHAASAFFASPFDEAAILTVDGVGEWATATWGVGRDTNVQLLHHIDFPHSLGLLYSAFTYFLGFKVNSAEYKVMGLAPYGEPRFTDLVFKELVHLMEDGSFWLNLDYFDYPHGLRMTGKKMEALFGIPTRQPESELEQVHKDIAASLQVVTEEIMVRMANHVHRETGLDRLCLAGGVALNCVANGRILREAPFKELYIQPAAGDAGGALGVAYQIHHAVAGKPRSKPMKDAYLGPAFDDAAIEAVVKRYGVKHRRLERDELLQETARLIDEQNVVGWFQGRMEFGPRALGNRSIIADARNADNRDKVNLAIKFRESFRPFAPSTLEESASEWFALNGTPSPYMLLVADVHENKRTIPAVTHVDGSARIQTVRRSENPLYYDLIKAFGDRTGCPVIINTSFNVRGEPIVCTPEEAFLCFMRTNMDHLVMGSFHLDKKDMPHMPDIGDARELFELD